MNLGGPEMLLLGILALILFGPRRLPELGRALGEGLAAFRESSRQLSSEFRRQLEEETAAPPAPPTPTAPPASQPMSTPMSTPALAETPQEDVVAAFESDMAAEPENTPA